MMTDPSTPPRPVVRLRPKAGARAIRHGFPWVFADELVTDRRSRALAPGTLAVLEAGLRSYERVARLALALVAPGGCLGLCSCSHAVDLGAFRTASSRGIGGAGRASQIIHTGFAGPDHSLMPQLAESGYLKALFYRMLP